MIRNCPEYGNDRYVPGILQKFRTRFNISGHFQYTIFTTNFIIHFIINLIQITYYIRLKINLIYLMILLFNVINAINIIIRSYDKIKNAREEQNVKKFTPFKYFEY